MRKLREKFEKFIVCCGNICVQEKFYLFYNFNMNFKNAITVKFEESF